ncbi:hypothetical protein XENOCAPTIV_010054 [Xenoophorus captivus]|uniref:Uncharacterized protein n=1 Tax=Xenoophorus captivus TaxID=1517983 RepID=A0ABV0SF67_9TELE
MGKINSCLKAVFISFNSLFSAVGLMLIYGLVKSAGMSEMERMDAPSVIWVWVFAICMLGISMLGTHAARTENKSCLKVFAGFMGIGMIVMLIFGIAVAVLKKPVICHILYMVHINGQHKDYRSVWELHGSVGRAGVLCTDGCLS